MTKVDFLLLHARLVTPPPKAQALGGRVELREIGDGALGAASGRIVAVGDTEEVLSRVTVVPEAKLLDAEGRVALPGLVDCHTHLVWAEDGLGQLGGRSSRLPGQDDHQARLSTAPRPSAPDALLPGLMARLRIALRHGTTTWEVKSGYGLTLEDQLPSLAAVARAAKLTGLPLVPTLFATQTWPEGAEREACLDLFKALAEEASRQGLARFVDAALGEGACSPDEARRVLADGLAAGLGVKLQVEGERGAQLAAELQAVSADHLLRTEDEALAALAEAGTAAVLLPGTWLCLGQEPFSADRARRHHLLAALATDANPRTSPTLSVPMAMALAVHLGGFSPEEALVMASINAARAVGEEAEAGSLSVGKRADLVLLDAEDWRAPVYHFGTNLVDTVISQGCVLVRHGQETEAVQGWRISSNG